MRSSSKDKIEYPDELTCDQIECYKTFRTFEDLKKTRSYADKISGVIYTQVDCDGEVMYSKGVRYVNRTEMYTVVK